MLPNLIHWANAYGERTNPLFLRIQELLTPESESFGLDFFRELIRQDADQPVMYLLRAL